MKKTMSIVVMAMLCLFFKAQSQNTAVDVTAKGIQVGQKVPDVLLTKIHNYKAETAKLSDFKGKLLILDFWATWCSPCIAMRPKMEEMQRQFDDKLQFLSVTYQKEEEVLPFLKKLMKGSQSLLPEVIEDQVLHELFPHVYLPHYVWIDQNGIVKAITGYEDVTVENITKLLSGKTELARKKDMSLAYDKGKPFLIGNNGGDGSNMIYHSVLTGHIDGLFGGYKITPPDSIIGRRITFTNIPLLWIYRQAYGNGKNFFVNNRVNLEVSDKDKFTTRKSGREYDIWAKGNEYCYELQIPASSLNNFYQYMQQDLERMFPQYKASVVKRKTKCLALVRTSKADKIKTRGDKSNIKFTSQGFVLENFPLESLVVQLNALYMQNSPLPIINDTRYTPWVDLTIDANLSSLAELNMALAKYDLALREKELLIDMLVISNVKSK